jgi:hypothetical protein
MFLESIDLQNYRNLKVRQHLAWDVPLAAHSARSMHTDYCARKFTISLLHKGSVGQTQEHHCTYRVVFKVHHGAFQGHPRSPEQPHEEGQSTPE